MAVRTENRKKRESLLVEFQGFISERSEENIKNQGQTPISMILTYAIELNVVILK